jgi:tetratricopeptide (TPR) repeat protein
MWVGRYLGVGCYILLATTTLNAQPAENKVLAEQLFAQARALVKAGNWAEACPKFEASLRYDATLGTRLNLATCLERIGKLASAWGLFRDSAELASVAGDIARRDYALEHADDLLPRLPKLTIAGPGVPPPGFTITRDGVALDLAALGTALYVDPGPHEVTASAPGFEPFKTTVSVGEAGAESVVLPELVPARTPQGDPRSSSSLRIESPERLTDNGSETNGSRKLIGLGVAGAGTALAGVGFFLGLRASSAFDDARTLCGAELICDNAADFARGEALIDRARTRATLSTVLVITGLAAVTAGAVVWITAPRRKHVEAAIVPVVTDRDLGLAVTRRF